MGPRTGLDAVQRFVYHLWSFRLYLAPMLKMRAAVPPSPIRHVLVFS